MAMVMTEKFRTKGIVVLGRRRLMMQQQSRTTSKQDSVNTYAF
jgi:hypothetical protein